MNNEWVITTKRLTRYFGNKQAVYGLDLNVPRGCMFGFLGRNGSGKTTTIRMLLGLLSPTRGRAAVLGHDSRSIPPEARARIGYLTESHQLYAWMRVKECSAFQSRFYPNWKSRIFESVIYHFGLSPDSLVKNLSRGERAGLCLALTLAPDPELLILDDPAIGLDPVARRSLLESMVYLTRRSDRTVFFSSHLLADVERVADFIAVLDRSVLRANCSLDTFRNRVRQMVLYFPGAPPPLPQIPGLLQAFRAEGEIRLTCTNYSPDTKRLLNSLGPERIEEVPVSLEDAFISFLGERGERSFFLSDERENS